MIIIQALKVLCHESYNVGLHEAQFKTFALNSFVTSHHGSSVLNKLIRITQLVWAKAALQMTLHKSTCRVTTLSQHISNTTALLPVELFLPTKYYIKQRCWVHNVMNINTIKTLCYSHIAHSYIHYINQQMLSVKYNKIAYSILLSAFDGWCSEWSEHLVSCNYQ